MRHYTKGLTIGTAIVVLALGGMLHAQVVPARPGTPVRPVQPAQVVQPAAGAPVAMVEDQFQTQQLITHALCMTIDGAELQCTVHRLSSTGHEQDGDKDKRRDDDKSKSTHQQTIQKLRQSASREFENGSQLLRAASTTLGAEANAAAESPSAWSRRLYTAANQYATTLRSLSGISDKRSNDSGGGSSNESKLSRTEGAQVALINQAVREAIDAFALSRTTNQQMIGNRAVAMPASAQQLQTHAREMATDSQQLIRDVGAMANPSRNEKQGDKDKQGEASVQTLAEQGQMIVDTLQRINPIAAAAAPASAPGTTPAPTGIPR